MTTQEVASLLGVNEQRVRWLVAHGRIPAQKIGRDWLFERAAVEEYNRQRKPAGRPPKSPPE